MNDKKQDNKKRKGVWVDVEGGKFEHEESGLVCVVTERVRGAPAFSFQIGHMDQRGFNKFIPCPVAGDIDVEHIVFSLAKRAREFIAERMEHAKMNPEKEGKPRGKKTRRGRNKKREDAKGGLSSLARADAVDKPEPFVGKTARRRNKRKATA